MDRIICACGFKPNLESFLSKDILESVEYDPNDSFAATTLAWDTLHPALPNMGFCGMYRGPYFGIMELQARLVAGHLSGRIRFDENELREALNISDGIRSFAPRAQVGWVRDRFLRCSIFTNLMWHVAHLPSSHTLIIPGTWTRWLNFALVQAV